jgi:hypothetical protein
LVQLVGQRRDLLGELRILREHLQMLLGHRPFTAEHVGLARLERDPRTRGTPRFRVC